MFIIYGGEDPSTMERIARLMYNIECGRKMVEWSPGSSGRLLPNPAGDFLTIEVPGHTKDSPPIKVVYRPKVGYVFYNPYIVRDPKRFADKLNGCLGRYPTTHLTGHIPVEVTPQTVLYHNNRISVKGSRVLTRNTFMMNWDPQKAYHARSIHVISMLIDFIAPRSKHTKYTQYPSSISRRSGFTWCVTPISDLRDSKVGSDPDAFNAFVASIYLDSITQGKETSVPTYNMKDVLPGILQENCRRAHNIGRRVMVIRGNGEMQAHAIPYQVNSYIPYWALPQEVENLPQEALPLVGNLSLDGIISRCGICTGGLWADVYILSDPTIDPWRMAICRWCAGCLPPHRKKTLFKATVSLDSRCKEALDTRALRIITIVNRSPDIYVLVQSPEGELFFLESKATYDSGLPPYLRSREFKYGHPSVSVDFLTLHKSARVE
jgi:hypothetical protein